MGGVEDWFLTASERGNGWARIDQGPSAAGWSAGNRVEVLVDGATYFGRLHDVLLLAARRRLVALHRLGEHAGRTPPGPRERAGHRARGLRSPRRARARPPVAFAPGPAELLRAAELLAHPARQRRRAVRSSSTSACDGEGATTRSCSWSAGAAAATTTSRSSAASTCRTVVTTTLATAETRRRSRSTRRSARTRRGTTCRRRCEGPAVAALADTFRERWEDPTPLDHRNPVRRVDQEVHPAAPPSRPVATETRGAGAGRHPRGAGAAHLPGQAPVLPVRPRRRAQHRPGVPQGAAARPPPGVHRGPVLLVAERAATRWPTR